MYGFLYGFFLAPFVRTLYYNSMQAYQLTTDGWERSLSERVIEFLEQRYRSQIGLRDVAEAFGYSPYYLTSAFARSTGLPITAWIVKRRIGAAQRLLGESDTSVAAACEAVGFNDVCYFTRQFVRYTGVTPGRFRSVHRGN
ncbi:MAG TPA: AraC family transcriptional regulator [Candidatus Acidoferrales bacterium]|nr:AraC family transcriptional regulator [Candidatus Acidoferrales bacterium]